MTNPVEGLAKVLLLLNENIQKTQMLRLSLIAYGSTRNSIVQTEKLALVAHDFGRLMPQIKQLELNGWDGLGDVACGYIADNYAHQLLWLKAIHSLPTSNCLAKLQPLHVCEASRQGCELIRLNPETLQRLVVEGGDIDIGFPTDKEAVLPKLAKLYLNSYGTPQNLRPLQLALPCLKYYADDSGHSALAKATLPKSMEELSICSDCETYKILSKTKLPSINEAYLSTTLYERNANVVLYMNQVLTTIGHSRKISFKYAALQFCQNISHVL
ncbi:hypothetical protein BX667DRAFT_495430, partial [Coemansia mojavensis]